MIGKITHQNDNQLESQIRDLYLILCIKLHLCDTLYIEFQWQKEQNKEYGKKIRKLKHGYGNGHDTDTDTTNNLKKSHNSV